MKSPRFYVSPEQWKSIGKSFIKYTLPLVIVFLTSVQAGIPIQDALPTLYGAAIQLLINFLSKFTTETI